MEEWIIGGILALFVIVPCWLALSRRREIQRQVKAWPELAQRTGLTFDSNIFSAPVWLDHYPGLHGTYRGRSLTVKLFGDSDRNAPPNTWISLDVQNPACFPLSFCAKTRCDPTQRLIQDQSGNPEFDRRFHMDGSPREYLQRAVYQIVRSDPGLLTWIMRNFPSIELKKDTLICSQNGELTDVDDLIALLNLLCDLIELAEQMGSMAAQEVTHD